MSDFENSQYSGPDRRSRNGCPVITEAQISLMIEEELERRLAKFEDKMLMHMDAKFAQLHKLITDAFPYGDPHGHRMHHEKVINNAGQWDKIKGEIISKFLTGGLWLAAGWLAFAIWQAFKNEVTK
jgi:hypothetical protein